MESSTYRKLFRANMRGWVEGELLDRLSPAFFEDPTSSVKEMGGKTIKESRWRWAALLSLPDERNIFIKRDKSKDWTDYLKYLFFPSKGRKEFLIASQLRSKNLNVPKALGWIEKTRSGLVEESYYLSQAIGTGVSLIDDVAGSKAPNTIHQLAATVRKFQDSGLYHQDLHAGNFLFQDESFFLTDLHRSRLVRHLSEKQKLWNLAHLFHSLRSAWREGEQLQFLSHYEEENVSESQRRVILFQKIYPVMNLLQKRQWRSRTKRCLKESTDFSVHAEKGARYFHRRDFQMEFLKNLLEKHRNLVRKNSTSLIKNAPEVVVSILENRGEKICLKQFRYPRFLDRLKEQLRRSKGMKSWVAANGMITRGVPSLKPLALYEGKNWLGLKESVLFMESLPEAQEMDRYILKGFGNVSRKRRFLQTFAHWLGHVHATGVYHKDMKTCNLIVSERGETWNFHLLDFEDISTEEKIDQKKLFRNFLQLNTSTPKLMSRSDRFRFFKEYLRLNPVVKEEKVFLRRLAKESRRRGLVYVSAHGVVTEEMG